MGLLCENCMIHPCDRRTRTDGQTDGRALAYSAL